MKKIALLVILIAVVFAFQPETSLAANDTSLASWCVGHGRDWADSECTVTGSAQVYQWERLTVATNETLTVGTYGYFRNFGAVNNHGTVRNNWTVVNYGTIDNYGSISNADTSNSLMDHHSSSSLSENASSVYILNYGAIINFCSGIYSGNPPLFYPVTESCSTTEVVIDIKPGSYDNPVNCRAERAVIPVAIITTVEFDALTVDHATVLFEGASETHDSKQDGPKRHEEDVDGDGDVDLLFHFRWGETGLDCDSTDATLNGELFQDLGGLSITGTDIITTVPRR